MKGRRLQPRSAYLSSRARQKVHVRNALTCAPYANWGKKNDKVYVCLEHLVNVCLALGHLFAFRGSCAFAKALGVVSCAIFPSYFPLHLDRVHLDLIGALSAFDPTWHVYPRQPADISEQDTWSTSLVL